MYQYKLILEDMSKCGGSCGCKERGDDYFDTIQKEYTSDPKAQISEAFDSLKDLLLYKNGKYGNSGIEPINVFSKASAETGLLQRIDDKIARIKNSPELRKNDIADLTGYLVLLCVKNGWTTFDEFKD